MDHTYAVIMAGGGGTRLWPVSRRDRPKQLLPLLDEQTLFQDTVKRLDGLLPPERILVVTVEEQAREMQVQVPAIPLENYLLEPAPRGTASAVGLAAAVLKNRDPESEMVILTADHFIRNVDLFHYLLKTAVDVAAQDYLVTLGIAPTYPSTAYGYIQQGEALAGSYGYPVYTVRRFKEKPDEAAAHQMIRSGDHSWNSGMFVWKTSRILAELEHQMPELSDVLKQISTTLGTAQQESVMKDCWPTLKTETIDYGVMEHAGQVAVLPASGLGWNDVGSWDSIFEVMLPDMNGNIDFNSQHLGLDTYNSLVYGAYENHEGRLVVTIGIDDLIVVDTEDVLLICKSDQSQKVRDVVAHLKKHHQERYL